MSQSLQLIGNVDTRDTEIDALREQVATLEVELENARREVTQTRKENVRAIASLRRHLSPLYQALQAVFGELDTIGGVDEPTTQASNPRVNAVWQSWKSKLGGSCAKLIDALLLHGEMNTQQLAIAVGLHRTTIPALIYKLNQAGLINKSGGKFSLKSL